MVTQSREIMEASAYSTGTAAMFAPHISMAKHSPSEKGTPGRAPFMNTAASAYVQYTSTLFKFILTRITALYIAAMPIFCLCLGLFVT